MSRSRVVRFVAIALLPQLVGGWYGIVVLSSVMDFILFEWIQGGCQAALLLNRRKAVPGHSYPMYITLWLLWIFIVLR